MPLVRIEMIRGVRTPEEIVRLADVVQEVLLKTFNAPPRDRYQVSFQSLSKHLINLTSKDHHAT